MSSSSDKTTNDDDDDDDGSGNKYAREMVRFLNDSWTPYHAVLATAKTLLKNGYREISEKDRFLDAELKPMGKYFYTRGLSSVVAFAVGGEYEPGNGFVMIGAHTDSPCPKLKPKTKVALNSQTDLMQVAVQPYGGGLWHTWFDRDLGVAGRVVLADEKSGKVEHRLVKIEEPMLRVPNLAIHLNRDIYTEGFKVNFQTHMAPLLGLKPKKEGESSSDDKGNNNGGYNNHHHSEFLEKLARALNCDPSSIRDFDLQLCDVQPSQIGGLNGEFVLSGRLDNLASCYCSLAALVEATTEEKLKKEKGIRALLHFDHEEVGSASTTGAGGSLTDEFVDRVTSAFGNGDADALATARRKSFLVSADMAHAVHPNYADKHEPGHKPKFGDGVVIKHNANQRYSTDAITSFMFKEIGERRKIKSQEFVVRSDLGCGSTIGPILSTRSGIRTVDVGMPQLSMHSIREMCGTEDTRLCVEHFRAVYEDFFEMDEKMIVDGSIGQLCRPCDRFESSPSVGVSSLSDEMKSMSARTYSS